jgi:hypothetical protein
MKQFKHAALAMAMASLLSAQAHASESQALKPEDAKPIIFSQTDANVIFDQTGKPMQLAALSQQEMKDTQGAWIWWAASGAVGGAVNTAGYIMNNPNWTYGGAGYALLSGVGGGLIAGLPGSNIARLGYTALGGLAAAQPLRNFN